MDLLCLQFNQGGLSIENIKAFLGPDFDCWDDISCKFKEKEGLYWNERLELEKNHRKAYSDSRRKNLSTSPTHMQKHMPQHKPTHMEDEDEDENRNRIINETSTVKNKGLSNRKKPMTSFPDGFQITANHMKWAGAKGFKDWDLDQQMEAFRDFHLSKGSRFAEWDRAFYTWLRNAKRINGEAQVKKESTFERAKAYTERVLSADREV